jgi:alpha-D-ribose 1-methylphosphonate 5-triphosphate synthase subunit PhnH
MDALARPGEIKRVQASLSPPHPLSPTTAAAALALADYETPIWLDAALSEAPDVAGWLKFHTGARMTDRKSQASFALAAAPGRLPALNEFALGTLDYPDRSTTLILQVDDFDSGEGFMLSGPGVLGNRPFRAGPLPPDLPEELAANRLLFPCGVDIILTGPESIAALPRSTRVLREF